MIVLSAEVSTSELGTQSHEAASALYRSSSPSLSELIAQWDSSGAAASAAARRRESSRGTISTSSILTDVRPVNTEAARTEVTSTSRVTPEGYVLVPASAARQAGIQTIGGEISSLQGAGGLNRAGTQTTRVLTTGTTSTGSLFNTPQRK